MKIEFDYWNVFLTTLTILGAIFLVNLILLLLIVLGLELFDYQLISQILTK